MKIDKLWECPAIMLEHKKGTPPQTMQSFLKIVSKKLPAESKTAKPFTSKQRQALYTKNVRNWFAQKLNTLQEKELEILETMFNPAWDQMYNYLTTAISLGNLEIEKRKHEGENDTEEGWD